MKCIQPHSSHGNQGHVTVMTYAEMVELKLNLFAKWGKPACLVIIESICKSICNSPAYLVIIEVHAQAWGQLTPGCKLVRSLSQSMHCLNMWLTKFLLFIIVSCSKRLLAVRQYGLRVQEEWIIQSNLQKSIQTDSQCLV